MITTRVSLSNRHIPSSQPFAWNAWVCRLHSSWHSNSNQGDHQRWCREQKPKPNKQHMLLQVPRKVSSRTFLGRSCLFYCQARDVHAANKRRRKTTKVFLSLCEKRLLEDRKFKKLSTDALFKISVAYADGRLGFLLRWRPRLRVENGNGYYLLQVGAGDLLLHYLQLTGSHFFKIITTGIELTVT